MRQIMTQTGYVPINQFAPPKRHKEAKDRHRTTVKKRQPEKRGPKPKEGMIILAQKKILKKNDTAL